MSKLFTVIFALLINASLFAGSGIFQDYIILDIDGGGNTFLAGGINGDGGAPYTGATLGTPGSLILNGGEVKTFKNSSDDIFGAKLFYRVYKSGSPASSFVELDLPFNADLGGGDQRWQKSDANVDILAMAASNGTWILEAYWTSPYNFGTHTDDNTGAYYSNTFMVTTLPVELTSFTATPEPKAVALNWTTSSEEHNASFEVQKSADGKNFETIGTIEGAGTSVVINTYNFTDESPVAGNSYYRLKQIDFDGTFEYSDILSVVFDTKITATIFPNPTSESLIVATEIQEEVTIRVFNMNGQVVFQSMQNVDNQVEINLSTLTNGNYIIQVTTTNNQSIIYKGAFVKQ